LTSYHTKTLLTYRTYLKHSKLAFLSFLFVYFLLFRPKFQHETTKRNKEHKGNTKPIINLNEYYTQKETIHSQGMGWLFGSDVCEEKTLTMRKTRQQSVVHISQQ
jgi:hypothetical protein